MYFLRKKLHRAAMITLVSFFLPVFFVNAQSINYNNFNLFERFSLRTFCTFAYCESDNNIKKENNLNIFERISIDTYCTFSICKPKKKKEEEPVVSIINNDDSENKEDTSLNYYPQAEIQVYRGARGHQGPQGEQGISGEDGARGPSGYDGEDGRDGSDGRNGARGPRGYDGSDGSNGADGIDGVNGLNGVPFDTDLDTGIKVEAIADEDIIRFDIGDTEGTAYTDALIIGGDTTGGFIWNENSNANLNFRIESDNNDNAFFIDSANDDILIGGNTIATSSIYFDVNGAATFNEQGNDVDFRIEGDTNENLLFVDASTDRIGIGTDTPQEKLHLDDGTFLTTPGGPTLKGTRDTPGNAYRVYISGKYAYVADDISGLQIIDISDPTTPTLVGTYDTSGNALDVYVSGKYAYVADDISGLQIIDISDPTTTTLAGTLDTTGRARGVYISGKYAYVADDYSGLQIIDISDPTTPTLVGTYDTLDYAYKVYISGKYAYVAGADSGLQIIDVSDQSNPILISQFGTPDRVFDVKVLGKYTYLSEGLSGISILDTSDPTNPIVVGFLDTDATTGLYISGKYAYVADYNSGIKVINISDPTTPTLVGTYDTSGNALDVYVSGKYAYVADDISGLQILDIGGIDTQAANIGDISTSTIDVTENMNVHNNLYVDGGLNVGPGGILSQGDICIEDGTCLGDSIWQESGGIITPTTSTNHLISITNNSDNTLTGFKSINTNDISTYAGAVLEMKGSGPDYTNNMYFGKYGDMFWVPSWAGNGVMATDQDLVIGSMGSSDATNPNSDPTIQFQVGGGYSTPNNLMNLTTTGLAFNTGTRVNLFLDEDNFVSNSDTALATQQSIKAYVDNYISTSIFDTDLDTGIKVEAIADEDIIRFDIGDTEGTAYTDALIIGGDTTGGFIWNENSNANLNFRIEGDTNENLLFVDASTDRIGIGTNTPQEKLHLDDGTFLTTPRDPVPIGSINDTTCDTANGGLCELDGAYDVYVSGKYAYVASSIDNGVEILDISDPSNPTHVGSIDDTTCDTANGGLCELDGASSIYVSGKYAYVASSIDNGVEILDISDPTNPTHVGSIDDTTCDTANGGLCELDGASSIYVSGKYAYVTSSASIDNGVEILDISDPTNPTHVGSINDTTCDTANGGLCELDGAYDVYVSGKYAYVASSIDNGVEILDISDPSNPTHVGSITDDATTALKGARGIYVSGKYAYVASQNDSGVEILDISDPTNPTHVGAIFDDATTVLTESYSIYVSGKYAYVASRLGHGVEILDISDPTNPTHVGAIFDDATTALVGANSIYVSGKYAYVASSIDDGVEILDIGGIDTHAANIGDLSASTIDVTENMNVHNNLYVDGGLNVGVGGLYVGVEESIGLHIDRTNAGAVAAFTDSNGTCEINPTTASLVCSSDKNLKKNFIYLDGKGNVESLQNNNADNVGDVIVNEDLGDENSLEKILQLRGVKYNWTQEEDTDTQHYGLIAQELQKVYPEMVLESSNGLLSVAYANLVVPLIESIKELFDKVLGNTQEIEQLKRIVCSDHPDDDYCSGSGDSSGGSDDNGGGSGSGDSSGGNNSNPTISISNESGIEGTNLGFIIKIDKISAEDIVIDVSTEDDTAVNPDDYVNVNETVIIYEGETEVNVSVTTVNNDIEDGDKNFKFKANVTSGIVENNSIEAIGTVIDDESDSNPPEDPVLGCMDDTATNYNVDATEDDGSCEYSNPPEDPVLGCMDDTATNYNVDATEDDGSCEYSNPPADTILGCTDDTATNYNVDATEDDGSCEYL